ncbi:TPA: phage N-6-adenine-methyltransferase [Vibrio parahaemolyticus]|nr:phage N-6-adenine-methyltransferase [Vibrio parahaemolyticus]
MKSQQQVFFKLGQSTLYEQDLFNGYQVNFARGVLVEEALPLLHSTLREASETFERMMLLPVRLKMPSRQDRSREQVMAEWGQQLFAQLDAMATKSSEMKALWHLIVSKGIYLVWAVDDRTESNRQVIAHLLIDTGNHLNTDIYSHFIVALQEQVISSYAKTLKLGKAQATTQCLLSMAHSSLVGKEDEQYEQHVRGLFYLLSGLAVKPEVEPEVNCPQLTIIRLQTTSDKRDLSVMYSSARTGVKLQDLWQTPPEIFNQLNQEFQFALDAAAESETALCANFFTEQEDALSQNWGNQTVFCNPPYSQLKAFARKGYEESRKGAKVVMLVPARTDTQAFHDYFSKGEVRFIKGRLKFLQNGEAQNTAPFPSMICVMGRDVEPKMVTVEQNCLSTPIN